MRKRERLELTFAGEATDRVPVVLWRHWPGDDQRAADFARYVVSFQRAYDWDFIRVEPFSAYMVSDYGVTTEWRGAVHGDRAIVRRAISRSLEWTDLRALDPSRGELGKHLDALKLMGDALSSDGLGEADDPTPIITTVYSPLAQAAMMAGPALLLRHIRTRPDRLRSGLNAITDTTLRFIEALRRTPVAGIVYVMTLADFSLMSHEEYAAFGLPFDHKVLEARPDKWWFTMLSLPGDAPMFQMAASYPAQAIHWLQGEGAPSLVEGRGLFSGAVCGGLDHAAHLHFGTPAQIRDAVRQAFYETAGRRLILAPDAVVAASAPRSNLRAVREAVMTPA
ncbi:MAG: uroporphyrinogen decarboxylase family protein [Chloroflexota bacterium]